MNTFFFNRKNVRHILVLISVLFTVASYLQALHYPFISDDIDYVAENTKLASLHWFELWRLFTKPYNAVAEFLPLRDLSYWLDITLFGLNPAAFRLHSIILYLLCLPLVYANSLALWRYFRPSDSASASWAAAAITALFVLHPSHTEAVVWVAGRKDVLSGLFSLVAIWLAIRARREQGLSVGYAFATLVALLAAMLSKATAIAVAPLISMLWIIFWCDAPKHDRRSSQLLWSLASLVLTGCIAIVFATIIESKVPLYFGIEAVTRSLAILGWLARIAVSPEERHFLYPVFEYTHLYIMVAFGVLVLIGAAVGLVMLFRKRSLEGFAAIAFLLLCIPSIQLIPYSPPSFVSDRFVFIGVLPIALLLVALAWRLNRLFRTVILIMLAFSWGIQTVERPRDWRSFERLIEIDSRAFPTYSMPAEYKIITQLSQKLISEANKTANQVMISEVRENMLKLIKATQALLDSALIGDPHNAVNYFSELDIDLRDLPLQAQWDTPITLIWKKNRTNLETEWGYLLRNFPDNALVQNSARQAQFSSWESKNKEMKFRPTTSNQPLSTKN